MSFEKRVYISALYASRSARISDEMERYFWPDELNTNQAMLDITGPLFRPSWMWARKPIEKAMMMMFEMGRRKNRKWSDTYVSTGALPDRKWRVTSNHKWWHR